MFPDVWAESMICVLVMAKARLLLSWLRFPWTASCSTKYPRTQCKNTTCSFFLLHLMFSAYFRPYSRRLITSLFLPFQRRTLNVLFSSFRKLSLFIPFTHSPSHSTRCVSVLLIITWVSFWFISTQKSVSHSESTPPSTLTALWKVHVIFIFLCTCFVWDKKVIKEIKAIS